ncbi:MAG: hypothetical protein P4L62_03945 [Candidatus Pacebacteria bacterium]|nr:hypothetical protein [Candidatus Paceibacterota bacterium]MDR3583483.1 hypothetical protein [Candidatus Paceibacterota bacterium]
MSMDKMDDKKNIGMKDEAEEKAQMTQEEVKDGMDNAGEWSDKEMDEMEDM